VQLAPATWRHQAAALSPTTALGSEDFNRGFESAISIFKNNKVESVDVSDMLSKRTRATDPFSS
jgi:hypothetical protein